ncbi:S8 family serine peptidase [Leptospira interrogans]
MLVHALRLAAFSMVFTLIFASGLTLSVSSENAGLRNTFGITLVSPALADDDDDGDDDDDDDGPRPRRAPEFVVSAPTAAALDQIASLGYVIIARQSLATTGVEIARVRPPSGMSVASARAQINTQVQGAVMDLNHLYRPNEFSCGATGCAAFSMVGWPSPQTCQIETTIGMVDTSVNRDHPALRDRAIETVSVLSQGRQPSSSVHGTAIAALLVGRSDTTTPGLMPNARVIAAEAFHRARGADTGDVFDIVRAIDLLADRNVGVINLSFSGPANELLEQVVTAVAERGVMLVGAAGNDGPRAQPLYPAAYAPVIAATAIDHRSRIYRQANQGAHISFAAPGVRLRTAARASGGQLRSGTSYAVPFVTAALAVKRARQPNASPSDLVSRLAGQANDLGEPGRDPVFGWGLIQMPAACSAPAG